MTRRCSHCGHNGHNSRTCPDRGVKLFGVRLTDGLMRKSVSMGNLSHYNSQALSSSTPEHSESGGAAGEGYVSDGLVQTSSSVRERKKGVPWTEEEHRMFLLGLQKLGKGDWRGISRNFVTTRTPTQVASHAQKYFLRQSNLNKRKRRSSLFDIPADTVACSMVEHSSPKAIDLGLPIPELSLGRSPSLSSAHILDAPGCSKYGISMRGFSIPNGLPLALSADLSLGRTQMVTEQGGESAGWNGFGDSDSNSVLQRPIPVSPGSSGSEPSGFSASPANPGHPLPFALPLWPGLGSQITVTPGPASPTSTNIFIMSASPPSGDNRIIRPTATMPSTLARIDEAVELSNLSLSIGPPAVEPSPLSLKLDQPSRHSAFHTNAAMASSSGSISSNGSLNSAISVV